ncbi:hypothetical protein PSTT_10385 [Puccinia striiformis]|uniref:lytic cellulose monooxygenase (C4-dehydrogenating) n=1 Tax=Puccinia striiformis TaxID=27350 RepID=A0A2S4V4S8_9BASI|nr:hypothetical protein PSTT_10385 [Puccinia striiformis]
MLNCPSRAFSSLDIWWPSVLTHTSFYFCDDDPIDPIPFGHLALLNSRPAIISSPQITLCYTTFRRSNSRDNNLYLSEKTKDGKIKTNPVSSHLLCLDTYRGRPRLCKSWSADDQKFEKAQKQPLSDTAFRNAPSNIGWIGSQFIQSPAFVCGASDTPKDQVAAPGGTLFSAADQSAKKTLPVNAGGKVSIIIGGNPGEGFPHPTGHLLAYLGYCGSSSTACQNFDASKTDYHRIQAEIDGISNKLRKQYNSEQDGDRWDVPIPKGIMDGSYILRLEMIAFDQSSPEEGHQDQYYVFCGQIAIKGGTGSSPAPDDDQPMIKVQSAFKPGNISPKSLPSPIKLAVSSSAKDSKTIIQSKSLDPEIKDTKSSDSSVTDSSDSKSKVTSVCGDRCYKKKLTELKDLAPSCSADQFDCLCKSQAFVKAYQSCCNDHCEGVQETQTAVNDIYNRCASANSTSASDGQSKSDSQSSTTQSPEANSTDLSKKSSKAKDSKSSGNGSKLPSACNGVCYKAKTTSSELHHLAPSCKVDDLDCLCRSHKWVCSYAACAHDNCPSAQEADKATDEIYAICEARLSSTNRLPTTDYIPESLNPSSATKSKSDKCSQTCLRKISSSSNCASPDNLNCICKSRSDVCAWAKCAEDQCFDEVDAIRLASDQIYEQCSKQ